MLSFRFGKTAGWQGVAAGNAGDICHCAAATVGIESDGILVRCRRCVLPQRLDCDVSGDGHRGVHRILRTVDLPCLELLSFGRNKLALRQRILAAAQYLLGGHCGGDLLWQILGFGAAVRVKSDGMLVALFKRCSYGDVFLRLGEGIGIILNCKAGGSTVDGQRTEHIALIGCNGEHDKVVLAEQGRAVLGGFCGIHHRDCAVFTACSRYPVLRCTGHRYLYRNRLQGFLLRWDDNVHARQVKRSVHGKVLLLPDRRGIVRRLVPFDRNRNALIPTGRRPDGDRGRQRFRQHRAMRELLLVERIDMGQRVPADLIFQIENRISTGVSDINIVVDIVVHVRRDRINAVFIRLQNRLAVLHRNRRLVMHLELQIAPVGRAFHRGCARIGFAFQLLAGGMHCGRRI